MDLLLLKLIYNQYVNFVSEVTIMNNISIPKIDLHCHLDGSFSLDYVKNTLKLNISDEELKNQLTAPADCNSLAEYLTRFDIPISCLQTPDNITAGILDVIKQASIDNVSYIEIRFAPNCSLNENQSYQDIYEACIKGVKLGRELYNVYSNIIVCAMRHHSMETNLQVLKSAGDYLGQGICALDLAGDEASFGNELFVDLFKTAKDMEMPFTIHSGECGSANNVKIALALGAKRVGHGIALIKDKSLMEECKKKRIGLELCPTSNYQTKAVKPGEIYPLRHFLDEGLLATVNTDNRTVSDTTMEKELLFAINNLDIREEDLQTIYKNSVEISFADNNIKNQLLKLI